MSNLDRYATEFDEIVRKIEMRLKNENFNNADIANKSVNDAKMLLSSAKQLVFKILNYS